MDIEKNWTKSEVRIHVAEETLDKQIADCLEDYRADQLMIKGGSESMVSLQMASYRIHLAVLFL